MPSEPTSMEEQFGPYDPSQDDSQHAPAPSLEACVAAINGKYDAGAMRAYKHLGVNDSTIRAVVADCVDVVKAHWPTAPAVEPPESPPDLTFAAVNDFVHHPEQQFEHLQWLCLTLATALEKAKGAAVEPPKCDPIQMFRCDECDPSFTCWMKGECRKKPKSSMEPSEATALADRLAACVIDHRNYHASSLCDEAADAVDVLRSQRDEIEKLKAVLADECETDAEVRKIAARVLRPLDCVGDSNGVPRLADIADSLVAEIERLQGAMNAMGDFSYKKLADAVAENESLRTAHAEMVRRLEELEVRHANLLNYANTLVNTTWAIVPHPKEIGRRIRSILAESAPKEKA